MTRATIDVRIDEIEKSVSKLNDRLDATLTPLNNDVSALKNRMDQISTQLNSRVDQISTQLNSMAEMLSAFTKFKGTSTSPTISDPSSSTTPAAVLPPNNSPPAAVPPAAIPTLVFPPNLAPPIGVPPPLPAVPAQLHSRIELPTFDGRDPRSWVARAEQFFMVNKTPAAERVNLALVAMTGDALYWVQWMLRRFPTIAWNQFTNELLLRFDDGTAVNEYEAMGITRQHGSVEDYISDFVARVAQLPNLPEQFYLGQFLAGLTDDVRSRIPAEPSMQVFTAIRWARQIDREHSFSQDCEKRRTNFSVSALRSDLPPKPVGNPTQPSPDTSSSAPRSAPRPYRRLTPEELDEYRAAGKCFKCSLPYSPHHECPYKSLRLIIAEDDDLLSPRSSAQELIHNKDSANLSDTSDYSKRELRCYHLSDLAGVPP